MEPLKLKVKDLEAMDLKEEGKDMYLFLRNGGIIRFHGTHFWSKWDNEFTICFYAFNETEAISFCTFDKRDIDYVQLER